MYTIVVADDEEELRKSIIRKINWEELGFRVVGEAENGIEALDLVTKKEPDLLLSDIRMPFISGLELAREVREVRPSTQIAFLSGYDDFAYAQEAIRYNIISYLLKPISMEELTENLRQIKEKLDDIFSGFSERTREESNTSAAFLLPLLLDGTQAAASKEREERLMAQAVSRKLLGPEHHDIHFAVMSLTILDASGQNCTEYSYTHAVGSILKKYMKAETFFLEDRITAVMMATSQSFEKYLHIVTDEVQQSVERILGLRACIGISEPAEQFSLLARAYRESLEAMQDARESEGSGIRYIRDLLAERRVKNSMDICEQALRYINENYEDAQLSLMSASGRIGISPNYLSALIKKRTGKSFVDYLTAKRMEQAKKLLLETPMKVREIASACGYSDQHYFSYCFKKYEGKSPNQLRMNTERTNS